MQRQKYNQQTYSTKWRGDIKIPIPLPACRYPSAIGNPESSPKTKIRLKGNRTEYGFKRIELIELNIDL